MKNFLLLFILVTLGFTQVFPLPRFALKTGGQCADCHINPTGGNIRAERGWSFSKNKLAMMPLPGSDEGEEQELSPKIGKNISFGVDYRTQLLYSDKTPRDSSKRIDFQKMTGSIYTNIALSSKMNIFARYDFVWQIWEAYGILNILPNDGYVKAGTFTPYFGIRLDDHTAYTRGGDLGVLFATGKRQGLIYEPRYNITGVEVGYNISDFGLLTLSAGNRLSSTFITDPDYNARLEFTPAVGDVKFLVGGSFAAFRDFQIDAQYNSVQQEVKIYGGFGGFSIGPVSLLTEYDVAQNLLKKDSDASALMAELSYNITNGLDAIARYDAYNPDTKSSGNEFSHIILGFEVFPYSFVELRPQFRINTDAQKNKTNSFVLQFHLFY